jgi:endonuclease YncB( thermonuclease family)
VEQPTKHVQQKAKISQSTYAKSATLSTLVSRKLLILVDVSIASTSASVVEQFLNKAFAKAALTAAFVFSGAAIAAPCPAPQTLSPVFKVDRVIDGDTVKLENGSRVRLTGFNTFELKDSGWKRDYALKAKRRAIEVLPEVVQVTPWPASKDRYGRLLGNLWMGQAYLGEVLVSEGLALTVSVPPENRLVRCLTSSEWNARKSRLGVWSLGQLPESAKTLASGGFQHRVGAVTQIIDKTTVILDGNLRVVFPKADPEIKLGVRYEVRGWISRSPKAVRGDWPWTLKLTDFRNRVRVF